MATHFKFTNVELVKRCGTYGDCSVSVVREMIVPISSIRSTYVKEDMNKKDVFRIGACLDYHRSYDEIRITKADYERLSKILLAD